MHLATRKTGVAGTAWQSGTRGPGQRRGVRVSLVEVLVGEGIDSGCGPLSTVSSYDHLFEVRVLLGDGRELFTFV